MKVRDACLLNTGVSTPVHTGLVFWMDARDLTFRDRVRNEPLNTVNQNNTWRVNRSFINGFLQLTASSGAAGGLNLNAQTAFENVQTMEALFSLGSDSANGTAIAGNGTSGSATSGVYLWYPPGRTLNIGTAGAWWWGKANANGEVTDQDVMHLVVTLDQNQIPSVYLNGQLRYTFHRSTSPFSGSRIVTYNVVQNAPRTLPFRIGSIRLYDRALSLPEIRKNIQYEIGTGRLTV